MLSGGVDESHDRGCYRETACAQSVLQEMVPLTVEHLRGLTVSLKLKLWKVPRTPSRLPFVFLVPCHHLILSHNL